MIQKYTFFDGGSIEFEDTKSVKALIAYAFEEFGFYEPLGMEIVTLFQAHHPETDVGWFTTDTSRRCVDEIKNPEELCFAYHMPGVFYFAEGGWGHHMPELGNHPEIPNAVSLPLRFDDFQNTVMINGEFRLRDVVTALKNAEYIPPDASRIRVLLIGSLGDGDTILFSDEMMDWRLTDFLQEIRARSEKLQTERKEYIYQEIFQIL